MHGSETWAIGRPEEKKLMAFESRYWRRMLKISWVERKTNEEVFRGEKFSEEYENKKMKDDWTYS